MIRVRGGFVIGDVVVVISSIDSSSYHRPCLQSYRVSRVLSYNRVAFTFYAIFGDCIAIFHSHGLLTQFNAALTSIALERYFR